MARTRKPKIFPATIIVDTREQAPFTFLGIDAWDEIPTIHRALKTGDYSLEGYEDQIAIERKTIADFYGSIGHGRERFEREMERMSRLRFAAVVIEGTWQDIFVNRPDNIQMPAKAAAHTILSWEVKYGVHFHDAESRYQAEKKTFHFLRHFYNQTIEQQKQQEIDFAWIDEIFV